MHSKQPRRFVYVAEWDNESRFESRAEPNRLAACPAALCELQTNETPDLLDRYRLAIE